MAVGLLSGEETLEAATGVVNIDTGVEATPDAVFQIGSVTKMYTATLVMQLVARGLVDLRAPITTYLPELKMEETADISDITVLHLLAHQRHRRRLLHRPGTTPEKLVAARPYRPDSRAGEMWSYSTRASCWPGIIEGDGSPMARGARYHAAEAAGG
jgi:CubicO group peptidase (beta-lactamase class C family)